MILAFLDDLMDRSRVTAAVPTAMFSRTVEPDPDVTLVFVDLARYGSSAAAIRTAYPDATVVGFGSHVARDALDAARGVGFDIVVTRSVFFADPAAYTSGQG